jgi:hypothetical protein
MRNLRLLLLGLLLRFAVTSPAAEQPLTVAIFDFSGNNGVVMAKDVTALVTADLSSNPHFTLVERAQLSKALGEQALGLSGNVDFGAAAKVGQLTGAKVLVTGRVMRMREGIVLIASIIGTETSRIYSEKVVGATNVTTLAAELSGKIARTIEEQATNFVGAALLTRQRLIDRLAEMTKGRTRPTVSIGISEKVLGERGPHRTTQNELGALLQKCGFEIVDEKADRRPDVLITGSAVADGGEKSGQLFPCRATLEVQAQERKSGKILSIDQQECAVSDIGRETAARLALENAADQLAERLVPNLLETNR